MESASHSPISSPRHQTWQAGNATVTLRRIHAAAEADLSGVLTEEELSRAARFHFAEDRHRWQQSRALLRTELAAALCCAPREVPLEIAPGGKPFVRGGPAFNLSHSGAFAALIIGDQRPVGVDVEAAGRHVDALRIAERYFVPHECEALRAASAADRDVLFLRLWTAKEALMKATGLGMRLAPDRISVALEGNNTVRVQRLDTGEEWPLHCREAADFYLAAVEL